MRETTAGDAVQQPKHLAVKHKKMLALAKERFMANRNQISQWEMFGKCQTDEVKLIKSSR